MSGSLPPARRRRPRRGSLDRPVNGRLYRSTLAVALLPLLLIALTISTPQALPRPTLPGTFDSAAAVTLARELSTNYPDRAPGAPGAGDGAPISGATLWFEQQLHSYGLGLNRDSWSAWVAGDGHVRLTNIQAIVRGQSHDAIVVVAHRDDLGVGPGANDDASGTGALIELARAYAEPTSAGTRAPVQSDHTIIFLSTDGDAFGDLGIRHFLATTPYRNEIVAVVDLDAIAGTGHAAIEIAGDRPSSPNAVLVATAAARIAEETGREPRHISLLGQLIDLGFPFSLYGQGPFIQAGISALTITTGELRAPPASEDDTIDAKSLGELGAASQELLGSLDQDVALAPSSSAFLWLDGRTVDGWAIELLFIALLVPCAAVIADLFALCRRANVALGPAVRALGRRLGFWAFVGVVFTCFCLVGVWPAASGSPPDPSEPGVGNTSIGALIAFGLVVVGGWGVAHRRLMVRRSVTNGDQLAGYLVGLTGVFIVSVLIAATNPFALIFVLPMLHIWLWVPQLTRAATRLIVAVAALAAPALVLVSFGSRDGLGFNAPWYLLQLVADGYVTPLAVALALAGIAGGCQVLAAAAGRYAPYPDRSERRMGGPFAPLIPALARAALARRDAAA